ncbi:ephrin type-A receptor 4-A-like isoform X2 [Oscarella lobularis]|uniref:ephrin type-A receptor 4-A-like isoform X2 n=1 Tax=Oscarella lobularis TaxID=121494 RepID=UPI0033142AC6
MKGGGGLLIIATIFAVLGRIVASSCSGNNGNCTCLDDPCTKCNDGCKLQDDCCVLQCGKGYAQLDIQPLCIAFLDTSSFKPTTTTKQTFYFGDDTVSLQLSNWMIDVWFQFPTDSNTNGLIQAKQLLADKNGFLRTYANSGSPQTKWIFTNDKKPDQVNNINSGNADSGQWNRLVVLWLPSSASSVIVFSSYNDESPRNTTVSASFSFTFNKITALGRTGRGNPKSVSAIAKFRAFSLGGSTSTTLIRYRDVYNQIRGCYDYSHINLTCFRCNTGWYYHNNRCYDSCPVGYTENNVTFSCTVLSTPSTVPSTSASVQVDSTNKTLTTSPTSIVKATTQPGNNSNVSSSPSALSTSTSSSTTATPSKMKSVTTSSSVSSPATTHGATTTRMPTSATGLKTNGPSTTFSSPTSSAVTTANEVTSTISKTNAPSTISSSQSSSAVTTASGITSTILKTNAPSTATVSSQTASAVTTASDITSTILSEVTTASATTGTKSIAATSQPPDTSPAQTLSSTKVIKSSTASIATTTQPIRSSASASTQSPTRGTPASLRPTSPSTMQSSSSNLSVVTVTTATTTTTKETEYFTTVTSTLSSKPPDSGSEGFKSNSKTILYIAVGAGGGLFLLIVIVVVVAVVAYKRRRKGKMNLRSGVGVNPFYDPMNFENPTFRRLNSVVATTSFSGNGAPVNVYDEPLPVTKQSNPRESAKSVNLTAEEPLYWQPASTESELYAQMEGKKMSKIDRKSVVMGKELGSGEFGVVALGKWSPVTHRGKEPIAVAVKTLSSSSTREDRVKFLREAAIMGQFRHKNVVALYGVVTVGEPILLVLELVENGDLKDWLVGVKTTLDYNQPDAESNLARRLLRSSSEIAAGMKYLSCKSFVHRDLAARNVMLDKEHTCKIGDFGMARDLADDTYYVTSGGKIPIRWTSPEALNFRKYSTASDVWSFGIVLYEIWSLGERPYGFMPNSEVQELLDAGYRLPPPPGCPRSIYHLMISCWNPEYHDRPSFTQVAKLLSGRQDEKILQNKPGEEAICGRLGADLDDSHSLYEDLQALYVRN